MRQATKTRGDLHRILYHSRECENVIRLPDLDGKFLNCRRRATPAEQIVPNPNLTVSPIWTEGGPARHASTRRESSTTCHFAPKMCRSAALGALGRCNQRCNDPAHFDRPAKTCGTFFFSRGENQSSNRIQEACPEHCRCGEGASRKS